MRVSQSWRILVKPPQTFVTLPDRFTLHISIFTDLNCLEGLLLLDFAQMFNSETQVACPLVKVDAILTHSIQSSGSTAITPDSVEDQASEGPNQSIQKIPDHNHMSGSFWNEIPDGSMKDSGQLQWGFYILVSAKYPKKARLYMESDPDDFNGRFQRNKHEKTLPKLLHTNLDLGREHPIHQQSNPNVVPGSVFRQGTSDTFPFGLVCPGQNSNPPSLVETNSKIMEERFWICKLSADRWSLAGFLWFLKSVLIKLWCIIWIL